MILALKSPQNVKTNKKPSHTNPLKECFSSSRESSEQEGPVPGLRAAVGFAEVVHREHRELTHPSFAAEASLSIYSRNMNHITILISAFHRLPKSCQLFPGPVWLREGEDGEEIPASVATGVRVRSNLPEGYFHFLEVGQLLVAMVAGGQSPGSLPGRG